MHYETDFLNADVKLKAMEIVNLLLNRRSFW